MNKEEKIRITIEVIENLIKHETEDQIKLKKLINSNINEKHRKFNEELLKNSKKLKKEYENVLYQLRTEEFIIQVKNKGFEK